MTFILPHPPLLLLPADDAGEQARVSRVLPKECQVVRGVRDREFGPDLRLDLGQAGLAPSGSCPRGAVARVMGIVLLVSGQVRPPFCIQTVQREDADL